MSRKIGRIGKIAEFWLLTPDESFGTNVAQLCVSKWVLSQASLREKFLGFLLSETIETFRQLGPMQGRRSRQLAKIGFYAWFERKAYWLPFFCSPIQSAFDAGVGGLSVDGGARLTAVGRLAIQQNRAQNGSGGKNP